VAKWWDTRAGRTAIIVGSALAFAAVGLLWTRITGQWGGRTYCTGPPPLPGHRGGVACIDYSPSWGWVVFGMSLGALFGCLLAVAGFKLYRLNGRHTGHHP
jgi:hypothetical protein